MASVFSEIDILLGRLNDLKPIKPECQEKFDSKIRLEFNYNSNHIEGNTLTYGETKLLLLFDKTTGNHDLREYEEMKAHDVAFEMVKELASSERPLSEMEIKNLHKILLVKPFWKDALSPDGQPTRRLIKTGAYKEQPNSVILQNGEIFHYSSPEETPIQMGELIQWYRKEEEKKELHPVALAAVLHYKFVRIHPFDDGNGRLSRLLANYVLIKNGLPPIVIKSSDKKRYLQALNQADSGNLEAFVEYIASVSLESLDLLIRAAKGEVIEETEDLDKKIELLKIKLGKQPNNKVELYFSTDAVVKILTESIFPLANKWHEKLQKLEPLFLEGQIKFHLGGAVITGKFFSDVVANKILSVVTGANYRQVGQGMSMTASFAGLRNIDSNLGINAGGINIHFHRNSYEILWDSNHKKINRLYTQPLTETEIDDIIFDTVNKFYNRLEALVNDRKK